MDVSTFSCKMPSFKPNSSILKHTIKEDEEGDSYKPTVVCGIHHGETMVSFDLVFFISPFSPWEQVRGHSL